MQFGLKPTLQTSNVIPFAMRRRGELYFTTIAEVGPQVFERTLLVILEQFIERFACAVIKLI